MGKLKTIFVKRVGQDVYEKHSDEFSTDFTKNKEVIERFLIIKSKKMKFLLVSL